MYSLVNPTADSTNRSICGKYDLTGQREFYVFVRTDNKLEVRLSYDGLGNEAFISNETLVNGSYNTVECTFNSGELTIIINGVSQSFTASQASLFPGNGDFVIGERNGGANKFKGEITLISIRQHSFNFAEGNGDTLHNVGGANATISGSTLSTFWGQSQDAYHYNYSNGFDLWENGTAGEEIRVPIGKTVTQSGYTLTASFPAKVGLNNCESEIDFDVALGFTHDPLAYSEFQQNFDSSNETYSCVKDGDHKNIRFYSPALTTAQNTKLINCYSKKGC